MKNDDLLATYQPEGVSLRLATQPEANAFRLIRPNHSKEHIQFNLLSGTLSLASGFFCAMAKPGG